MNLFIWRKNNASFSGYLDSYIFVKSTDFKIYDVTADIAAKWKLQLCLFLLNTKYYQTKHWNLDITGYRVIGAGC